MLKTAFRIFICSFIIILSAKNIYSQECEQCKTRNIIIFDNSILVPRPTGTNDELAAKIPKWWDLFFIASGEDQYFTEDPSRECFTKLCEAFFTVKDTMLYSIKVGTEHANSAPDGSIGGAADYILTGSISGNESNYVFSLNLETAKTRDVLKSVSVNFASGFDPFVIGKQAATQFGPLYNTIMEYEKRKRDEGEPYAINPEIEVKPEKTEIKVGESTDVEFTLTDCDGAVLPNRKIDLTSVTLGSFDPSDITTDDQGKAKAKFTASAKGTASISARNDYKRAYSDATYIADKGVAFIAIEGPPRWFAEGTYEWKLVSTEKMSGPYWRSNEENFRLERGSFTASFEIKHNYGDYSSIDSTVTIVSNGSSINRKQRDYLMNVPETGSIREDEDEDCGGLQPSSREGKLGIVFFESGDKTIQFSSLVPMSFSGSGHSTSTTCDVTSGCTTEQDNSDCSGRELYLSFGLEAGSMIENTDTTYTVMGMQVKETGIIKKTTIHQGEDYQFTYVNNKTSQIGLDFLGQAKNTTIEKYSVSIHVIAKDYTGVETIDNHSKDYSLYQNYPNPFNPVTTITFSIPERNHVSLKIFDVLGNEVSTIVNEEKSAGKYPVKFDAGNLSSGIYFYHLNSGSYSKTLKLILMK